MAKTSSVIENRKGHTAVLVSNSKIIIYGGSRILNNIINNAQVVPVMFVLNMETEQFELSVPPVTSNI
ncbi:5288_t:CDS:2, partial [Funneliformis caledonium]